jgi:quinol monooxygenase YgiN
VENPVRRRLCLSDDEAIGAVAGDSLGENSFLFSCFPERILINDHPMSNVIVIVAYRPKPRRETELLELVRSRVPTLRKEGLVTDREPIIMRASDGTIIEVSEWKSQEAIDAAHKNPNVLAMWAKFFAICDCVPFTTLAEAEEMFPNFEPL